MDLYATLGIGKNAPPEEIKKAYRKLAMQYHPDRNIGDKEAENKFKEIAAAYGVLSDKDKKLRYDATGSTTTAGPSSGGTSGFSSGWSFFTDDAKPANPAERGRNIHMNIELDLMDVLNGINKKIVVPERERCIKCEGAGWKEFKACNICHGSGKVAMKVPGFNMYTSCTTCKGSGRAGTVSCKECKGEGCNSIGETELDVKVPPGIETGNQIKVPNFGEPSRNPFGKNGDLVLLMIVKEHKLFTRQSTNLFLELPVGYAELCLGSKIEIPTLTGTYILTLPPRTQDLSQLRLKGQGLPYLHATHRGDMIVVVKLVIPPKDSIKELTSKLEELKKIEDNYLNKEREKFK